MNMNTAKPMSDKEPRQIQDQSQRLVRNLDSLQESLGRLFSAIVPILSPSPDAQKLAGEGLPEDMAPHALFLLECNVKIRILVDQTEDIIEHVEI